MIMMFSSETGGETPPVVLILTKLIGLHLLD